MVTWYTYSFTDPTMGPSQFQVGGITEDVAKGIRFGLKKVPGITNVSVERSVESKEALAAGDPAP